MRRLGLGLLTAVMIVGFGGLQPAQATTIINGSYTFTTFPDPAPTGTGLGTLNVILFENSSGGSGNDCCGTVNVDNSNGILPTGSTTDSGSQFWITSIGDLRTFYASLFPNLLTADPNDSTVNEIVLFFDINQEGQTPGLDVNTLTIIKNATTTPPLDPTGTNDLTSTQQESITGFTGGTSLRSLTTTPQTLAQINTGAGIPDWLIFTGINPFDPSFSATDTLLFNFRISGLNDGPETLDISGTFSGFECTQDCLPPTQVPEPATLVLVGLGLLTVGITLRRRHQRQ